MDARQEVYSYRKSSRANLRSAALGLANRHGIFRYTNVTNTTLCNPVGPRKHLLGEESGRSEAGRNGQQEKPKY
jgi:hypothetical protein